MATLSTQYNESDYLPAVIMSIGIHLGFIVLLVVSIDFDFSSDTAVPANIIDAVVIDTGVLQPPPPKVTPEAQQKQRALAEQQALQKQREAAQKQEAIRLAKEKEQALALKLEQEQQRKLAEQKKLEAERKAAEERKRQAALAAQREAERKAAEELERQRLLQEEQDLLAAQEAEWRQQEAERIAAAEQARSNEIASKMALYKQAMKQKIERNWILPAAATVGAKCAVMLRQIPGGEVISVRIEFCDGDAALERSIENAIYKASPLPDPPEPSLFERDIRITFTVPDR